MMKFHRRHLLLLAVLIIPSLGRLEYDSVSQCLQSDAACSIDERKCNGRMIMKECLATRIPLAYFNQERLACCFHCCLKHLSTLYKISHDAKLVAVYNHSQKLEVKTLAESTTFMSPDKIYTISDMLVGPGMHAGERTMWKVLTTITPIPLHWRPLFGGRHNILTVFSDNCFSTDTFQYIRMMLTKKNDFGTLYYVAFFSTQVVCPAIAGRELPAFYNLLPVGIRSSLAMKRVKLRPKTKLLDCSCAASYSFFEEVQHELAASGIVCDTSGIVLNIAGKLNEHNSKDVDKLLLYYEYMSEFKYVLSLSSEKAMTHCEYEAMHVGAIPIVITPTHPLILDLYSDMPMVYVDSWSNLTGDTLEYDYESYQRQHQQATSFTKLHAPHWVSRLVPYLITGKPYVRAFQGLGSLASPIASCDTSDTRHISNSDNYAETAIYPLKSLHIHPKLHATERTLTLVIPRCCEDHLEFDWVGEVLARTSNKVRVAIYYKCPRCIPLSQASSWRHLAIYEDYDRPVHLFNDSVLTSFGNRVQQHPAFDSIYNGKEVTAYLQHILENYSSLSDQLMFLHSVPNAHLFQEVFYRTIRFFEYCGNDRIPVDYVHLNSKYKYGAWGRCCFNDNGSCVKSTWAYLFPRDASLQVTDKKYPVFASNLGHMEVKTYSSSQFMVSKHLILSRPYSFWERMMLALNGTVELEACPGHGDDWSLGHQLTGQYERLWHMIFYRPPTAPYRVKDMTLPKILKIDCFGGKCADGVV